MWSQCFSDLPAENHLPGYYEADGNQVLEHPSDEKKQDLWETFLAASVPMIPLYNRLCVR